MLHYTNETGTRWTALEIRDAATFDAAAALEDGRDPTGRAVVGLREDFGIAESDITVGAPVNGEPAPITIACHPGTIALEWDPMQDGYDYPTSGDDAHDTPDAESMDPRDLREAAIAILDNSDLSDADRDLVIRALA